MGKRMPVRAVQENRLRNWSVPGVVVSELFIPANG